MAAPTRPWRTGWCRRRSRGDFDSISARARAGIPPENLHPVTEQDSTDFEKCLSRIDAPLVIAVGFAGARHDHFLAALSTLSRRIGPPCILIAAEDVITLCPPEIALDLRPGTRLSLFPMGPASGYAQGLKWPINGLNFAPDARIGTSNAATGPVLLQTEGPMLLILPRANLVTLARALVSRFLLHSNIHAAATQSPPANAGIHRVPQSVADIVHRQNRKRNEGARQDHPPRIYAASDPPHRTAAAPRSGNPAESPAPEMTARFR